jgi:hypothetical protein
LELPVRKNTKEAQGICSQCATSEAWQAAVDLAQNANQLFKDADVPTKNKLLRLVLPANSILYDKKLVCNVFYPYKAVQELNDNGTTDTENTNWCANYTRLLTSAASELEGDVLLADLAETFGLRGDLLAV